MSIIFISHKLNEVLEIADRITVLRRGRKIDRDVPREGATEEGLARLMVGREVLLRVEKKPAKPGDVLLEVEDLRVRDDRDLEAVRGVSLEVRAGEIVGIAGVDDNGQSELIDAIAGPAAGRQPATSGSPGATSPARTRRQCSTTGSATSPRTGSGAASCSSSRSRRTSRCTTIDGRRTRGSAGSTRSGWSPRARAADQGVRRPRRRPADAGRRRSPAATSRRSCSRARSSRDPQGADRGAADARPRRRRDRVRPPPPRRASATRAARSCSSRSSSRRSCRSRTASSSSTRARSSASTRPTRPRRSSASP